MNSHNLSHEEGKRRGTNYEWICTWMQDGAFEVCTFERDYLASRHQIEREILLFWFSHELCSFTSSGHHCCLQIYIQSSRVNAFPQAPIVSMPSLLFCLSDSSQTPTLSAPAPAIPLVSLSPRFPIALGTHSRKHSSKHSLPPLPPSLPLSPCLIRRRRGGIFTRLPPPPPLKEFIDPGNLGAASLLLCCC